MERKELLEKKDFYNKNKNRLTPETLEKISKAFDIDFTYNSTTIEGNTLTLIETKTLLEDKIAIGGKKLREIYEVLNHNKAFDYVKDCIEQKEELDEDKIKDIHELLTENIMQGGIYRSTDVIITGAKHTPPTPNEMYKQLRFFYTDLQENKSKMNAIELAAWTHAEFVKIHPFPDGNGRTSRLIMNFQLMKKSFLPISIKAEDRLEYYNALDIYATTGDLKPFICLIENLEENRLDEINRIIKQQIESET
ncbi:MAG: Fic family protein [Clostridia bacterium]|nr:Fic family protein [Clostridia bacterium]